LVLFPQGFINVISYNIAGGGDDLTPTTFSEHRGQFRECFRQDEFENHCGHYPLVQDNLSRSVGGTLRGLHYQRNRPQGKLVQVISGTIFDVAVDIRLASSTYGQWLSCRLNAELGGLIWISPGFAHGFYVLSDSADVFTDVAIIIIPVMKLLFDGIALIWR